MPHPVNNEPTEEFDYRELRDAFGCFTTGVTIITAAGANDVMVGLTANSFSSVSLNPPLVSWSLAAHAPSLPVFLNCSHYAIHVLGCDQQSLAERFAQSRDDKFAGLELTVGLGDAPVLENALAVFQCLNSYRHSGGDHVVFLGEVKKFSFQTGKPLVFHRGKFSDLAD